jgi:hypothetical protein
LEASHQKDIDALSSASVDELDSAYLALTIDNQTRYLAQINPMLSTTNDPDLKLVLEKTLARVSAHLAQAQAVQLKYAGVVWMPRRRFRNNADGGRPVTAIAGA